MGNKPESDTAEFFFPDLQLEPSRDHRKILTVDLASRTHVGLVRKNNEDSYLIYRTGRYWEKLSTNLAGHLLPNRYEDTAYVLAVADGMGGMAAGEVASSLAIQTGVNLVLDAVKWALKLDTGESREAELEESIQRTVRYFRAIDQKVTREAAADPSLSGMGTTLTVAYIVGRDALVFHVGDSRAYLFRNNGIRLLTHDDTVAQALADSGTIQQEEVQTHQYRNVLTKSIGHSDGEIDIQVVHLELFPEDYLLVCSDGLTDMVSDKAIGRILADNPNPTEACDLLIEKALKNGGRDNTTVLLGKFTAG